MLYLASDHRGYTLKETVKKWLDQWGIAYSDCGAFSLNTKDDYPDFIFAAAKNIAADPETHKGIIFGHTGQGEAMAANRFPQIRAAVYYGREEEIPQLSREHNNANVLSVGASFIEPTSLKPLVKQWLKTPFSNAPRHKRRIEKLLHPPTV
jgi:ribose 5-phosphate isomerase B